MKSKIIYYIEILASLRSKELISLENNSPLNKKVKKQLEKLGRWYIVDIFKENKNKNNFIGGK